MYAHDFCFNGQTCSDHNLIICSYQSNSENTISGGEMEYIVAKSPRTYKNNYYGCNYNSPLEWQIGLCKNPCYFHNEIYFTQYEEREITNWLVKETGYRWLQFIQEGYEDVMYKVLINVLPEQVNGHTVAFNLTITSDSPYGYSQEFIRKSKISKDKPLVVKMASDSETYINPTIKFIGGDGITSFNNLEDTMMGETKIKFKGNEIIMDTENRIIEGIDKPDDFNYRYIRLLNGTNTIITDSSLPIDVEMRYREIRRVYV